MDSPNPFDNPHAVGVAEQQANALTTAMFHGAKCHPTDGIFDGSNNDDPILKRLRGKVTGMLNEDQPVGFCSHLVKKEVQPMFMRAWVRNRIQCYVCLPNDIKAPVGWACEVCEEVPRGDERLMIQMFSIAMVTYHFGTCRTCTDSMIKAMEPGRIAS